MTCCCVRSEDQHVLPYTQYHGALPRVQKKQLSVSATEHGQIAVYKTLSML